MKRLLFLAAVLLPNCTGCIAVGYPTVHYVPDLTVPNPDGSVHAFRVDVDTTVTPNGTKSQYTLSRMPIDSRGLIPSQLEIAPATKVLNPFGITGVTEEHNNYSMLVRVYRPGYRTIEVASWDKSRELQWLPAGDLAAQEKAVDDLLGVTGLGTTAGGWWSAVISNSNTTATSSVTPEKLSRTPPRVGDSGLQPGSVSSLHRQALLFAANEYSRLANGRLAVGPTMQTVRERLQQKAIWLRKWADETPKP